MNTVQIIKTTGDNGYMHDASRPWLLLISSGRHAYTYGRYTTEAIARRYARKAERELAA